MKMKSLGRSISPSARSRTFHLGGSRLQIPKENSRRNNYIYEVGVGTWKIKEAKTYHHNLCISNSELGGGSNQN